MEPGIVIATPYSRLARAVRGTDDNWTVQSPLEGKDVNCVTNDPSHPQTVYAGTRGEGVWRSEDGGATWRPCGLSEQIVKSIAVSPHDPDILFAGTKPAFLYTSRDGGGVWHELTGFRRIPGRWWWFTPAESPPQAYVIAITISPHDPQVVLAGVEFGGVFRSVDGGESWSGHRKGSLRDCHSLKFHTSQGDWIYQAGGTGGGAAYSQDKGVTWHKARHGLAKHYGVSCAADPLKPEIWYASVAPGPSRAYGGQVEAYLYRSDGKGNWQPIGWEPHPMKGMPLALVTIPGAAGHLYAGLNNGDVWHTGDYGDTWKQLPFNLKGMGLSMVVIGAN
ncbi:MAG: WD40/YVTN/BNR-like repeat-containing protein [Anaerolineales bacterium]